MLEPVKALAQWLRATPEKHIWMMGGCELIASFLYAKEIDEFDIHVIPTFIGEGTPLMAPRYGSTPTASSASATTSRDSSPKTPIAHLALC